MRIKRFISFSILFVAFLWRYKWVSGAEQLWLQSHVPKYVWKRILCLSQRICPVIWRLQNVHIWKPWTGAYITTLTCNLGTTTSTSSREPGNIATRRRLPTRICTGLGEFINLCWAWWLFCGEWGLWTYLHFVWNLPSMFLPEWIWTCERNCMYWCKQIFERFIITHEWWKCRHQHTNYSSRLVLGGEALKVDGWWWHNLESI